MRVSTSVIFTISILLICTKFIECQKCPKRKNAKWKFGVGVSHKAKRAPKPTRDGISNAAIADGLSRHDFAIDSRWGEGVDREVKSFKEKKSSHQIKYQWRQNAGWQHLCKEYRTSTQIREVFYKRGWCYVLSPWRNYRYPYRVCDSKNRSCLGVGDKAYWCMPDANRYFKIWMWCAHMKQKYLPFWFELPQACTCKRWRYKCDEQPDS